MATSPDPAGEATEHVLIVDQTPDEAWADFDADVRHRLGIGADDFARRYDAGEYPDPDADPDISWLAFAYVGLRRSGLPR